MKQPGKKKASNAAGASKSARRRESRAKASASSANDRALREQLAKLLDGGMAHASWQDVVADMPENLQGTKPEGAPHTAWQLLEHMRIAQWDILEFSRNPKHVSPQFPDGYWPSTDAPPNAEAWEKSAKAFGRDLAEMKKLVNDPKSDLFAQIAHGDGQTILREVLLAADHNATTWDRLCWYGNCSEHGRDRRDSHRFREEISLHSYKDLS